MIRTFDEPIVSYTGDLQVQNILDFLYVNEVPSVFEFSEAYVDKIFKSGKPSAVLFYKEKESALVEAFSTVAKTESWKGKIFFTTSGITEGEQLKFGQFIGVKTLPNIVIL